MFAPTRVTVLRTVGGRQVPIRVDLKRAILCPEERILIQPNDFVLLEYTGFETIGNLIMNNAFVNFSGRLW